MLCGRTLLSILQTPPRGDIWTILAHQAIAAELNAASGASTGHFVDAARAAASQFLADNCGGVRPRHALGALVVAAILAAYNEGYIGPGHCH